MKLIHIYVSFYKINFNIFLHNFFLWTDITFVSQLNSLITKINIVVEVDPNLTRDLLGWKILKRKKFLLTYIVYINFLIYL